MTITLSDYNAPQLPAQGVIHYRDGRRWTLRYERVDVPAPVVNLPPAAIHAFLQRSTSLTKRKETFSSR